MNCESHRQSPPHFAAAQLVTPRVEDPPNATELLFILHAIENDLGRVGQRRVAGHPMSTAVAEHVVLPGDVDNKVDRAGRRAIWQNALMSDLPTVGRLRP